MNLQSKSLFYQAILHSNKLSNVFHIRIIFHLSPSINPRTSDSDCEITTTGKERYEKYNQKRPTQLILHAAQLE